MPWQADLAEYFDGQDDQQGDAQKKAAKAGYDQQKGDHVAGRVDRFFRVKLSNKADDANDHVEQEIQHGHNVEDVQRHESEEGLLLDWSRKWHKKNAGQETES